MILVDDHSTDETVRVARTLPIHVVRHPHNTGYGANQKTCYMEALRRGADAVVMLYPDGQYPPELIPAMVEPILIGRTDLRARLPPRGPRDGPRQRDAAVEVPRQPASWRSPRTGSWARS